MSNILRKARETILSRRPDFDDHCIRRLNHKRKRAPISIMRHTIAEIMRSFSY